VDDLLKKLQVRTRFAPSPNGLLHPGHAYAAMTAHDFARDRGGAFLLRIEDIDGIRSRQDHIAAILEDMAWLGLRWDGEAIYQSQRLGSYQAGFDRLAKMGLTYRCFCTRADIAHVLKTQPVHHGPDGPVYPGTCRGLDATHAAERAANEPYCWRIDMARAAELTGPLSWEEVGRGTIAADPLAFGDIVIVRKDAPASYHLAATLDDARDGISHVVRGVDLFAYTAIHRLLQSLLSLPSPAYCHHGLLVDETGEKLAKSRHSATLRAMAEAGVDGRLFVDELRKGNLPSGIFLSSF
jgi:glutamyl-Q tRNA(Asp) synthetase